MEPSHQAAGIGLRVIGDKLYAGWDKPPAQYVVTIRRGLMGDYNLATDDGTGSYKVERIH